MNVPNEELIYMDGCDHEQISRFGSPRDPNYETILFHLKKVTKGKLFIRPIGDLMNRN